MSLKLEVGKNYISYNDSIIEIFYESKSTDSHIFYGRSRGNIKLVCSYTEDGTCCGLGPDLFKEHEEHEEQKEPFTNKRSGWVGYSEGEPFKNCTNSLLLNKKASSLIHDKKENILGYWEKSVYVEIDIKAFFNIN